jgi:hypothetical protein
MKLPTLLHPDIQELNEQKEYNMSFSYTASNLLQLIAELTRVERSLNAVSSNEKFCYPLR